MIWSICLTNGYSKNGSITLRKKVLNEKKSEHHLAVTSANGVESSKQD